MPIPSSGFVRVEGVGFQIACGPNGDPVSAKCYDDGALLDPMDDHVPGEHYGTSHFALLCAVLYRLTSDSQYLHRIAGAIAFQVRKKNAYAFGSWWEHWEFDNFAWAETYELLKTAGRTQLCRSIASWLRNPPRHRLPFATNWKLLALNSMARFREKPVLQRLLDLVRRAIYEMYLRRAILDDGCIDDVPGASRSIQYHAFSAALLGRLADVAPTSGRFAQVARAAAYLQTFADPNGVFNYKGRGHQQVFGYAAAIYALLHGSELADGSLEAAEMLHTAELLYSYMMEFRVDEAYFPLVLNDLDQGRRVGWYDYHHLSVYNAMVAAWMGLALLRFPATRGLHREAPPKVPQCDPDHMQVHVHAQSRVLIARDGLFLCVSGGERYYETDCGLAPHHISVRNWGPVVSCPGGPDWPSYSRYRTEIMSVNFLAPLVVHGELVLGPGHRVASGFDYDGGERVLCIEMSYEDATLVRRSIRFLQRGFEIRDNVCVTAGRSSCCLIGYNLPLLASAEAYVRLTTDGLELRHIHGQRLRVAVQSSLSGQSLAHKRTGNVAAGTILLFQSDPVPMEPERPEWFVQRWTLHASAPPERLTTEDANTLLLGAD
jgi:hypothetical protein